MAGGNVFTVELVEAGRVRELLPASSMWHAVDVVATTGSTNADLVATAQRSTREGHVLIAREQTAGRGRLARSWASPAGASVSVSVLLTPRRPLSDWGWLSLLTGLAVSEGLASVAGERASAIQLKWPNDVLIDGRKVCGILSEALPEVDAAVVGFGINTTMREPDLPVPTATSLGLAGLPTDHNAVVAAVLTRFEHHYRRWNTGGGLREIYEQRCTSVGRALRITAGQETVAGIGEGIDQEGRLLVRTATGIRAFAVGDVVHARLEG